MLEARPLDCLGMRLSALIPAALCTTLSIGLPLLGQDTPEASSEDTPEITSEDYRVYRGDGTPASFEDVTTAARAASAIFLGESHEDPVAHYLEEQIFLQVSSYDTALSLEMFERDTQPIVDEYLDGLITEGHFKKAARAWDNYASGYRPLVEYAKDHDIPVIAANAPQRYVNRVSRLGVEALLDLPRAARKHLAPLPVPPASDAYAAEFYDEMSQHSGPEEEEEEASTEAPPNVEVETAAGQNEAQTGSGTAASSEMDLTKALEAQNVWDATMAYSIAQYLLDHPTAHVVHVTGSFHVSRQLGTPEHLARYRPSSPTVVVTMIPASSLDFDRDRMLNQGDFVIVTDESLSPDNEAEESEATGDGAGSSESPASSGTP